LQTGGCSRLGSTLEILLHLGDQALQAVDLPGQRNGARALRLHALFDRVLLALPLLDQGGEPDLIVLQLVAVARQGIALVGDGLAERDQFGEVGGQPFRTAAQFGHDRAEQHRGAQRLQCVFRPHQERRRRAPSGALQRCQHLDDLGTPRIKRATNLLLAVAERTQPCFGVVDAGLDVAHLACDVDQLLIELAAVLADCGDVGLQLLLQLGCLLLLLARGLELLLALFDGLGRSGGRSRLLLRRRRLRDRGSKRHRDQAGGQQRDRKRYRGCQRPAAAIGAGLQMNVPQ
jgi:hypothetical protein